MRGTRKSRYLLGQQLAINAVNTAVRKGDLPKVSTLKCVDCGIQAQSYDHRDYNKPLEVDATCHSCNLKRGVGKPKSRFTKTHEKRLNEIDKQLEIKNRMYKDKLSEHYRKEEIVRLVASEDELFERIVELCSHLGVTPSQWIRDRIAQARLK